MPRKNHRVQRRRPRRVPAEPKQPAPSYDAIAHRLVDAGRCSPLILHDDQTHKSLTPSERKS